MNYEPRQVNKGDLLIIGRSLGLACHERERSVDLVKRIIDAAGELRRNHDHLARYNAELSRRAR